MLERNIKKLPITLSLSNGKWYNGIGKKIPAGTDHTDRIKESCYALT